MLEIESLKLTDVELADCGYLPRLYPAAARKVADEQLAKVLTVLMVAYQDDDPDCELYNDLRDIVSEMCAEDNNGKTD